MTEKKATQTKKKSPKEESFSLEAFKRMLSNREYDILVAYGTKGSYTKAEAEKIIKGVMK